MRHSGISRFILSCILLFLPFGHNKSNASDHEDNSFEKIFYLIYNQQFEDAFAELTLSGGGLDKWKYHILILDLYWWKAISSNCEDDFISFESKLKHFISNLENSDNIDDLEELITLSYSLRFASLRNRFLSMFTSLYRINFVIDRINTENLTKEQQDIFRIYFALFTIFKSKVLFNNPKLRKEGILVLESNLNSTWLVSKTISYYFLSKIYSDLEKRPIQALNYYEQLCLIYPGNKIFAGNLELCKTK